LKEGKANLKKGRNVTEMPAVPTRERGKNREGERESDWKYVTIKMGLFQLPREKGMSDAQSLIAKK